MARRTKQEALQTRNTILDNAEQVFFEKGVSRTSLADIAQAAGVTRGAIYWHFKNKGDVFTAMFDRVVLPLDELAEATLDMREPDPLGRIRALLIACLRDTTTDDQRRRVFDILFHKCEFTAEMGPVMERHQTSVREGRHRIEGGLKNAVAKGQLPTDLHTHRAATMLHSLIGGLLDDWLLSPPDVDLAGEADHFIDAYFDMLRYSPAMRVAVNGGAD